MIYIFSPLAVGIVSTYIVVVRAWEFRRTPPSSPYNTDCTFPWPSSHPPKDTADFIVSDLGKGPARWEKRNEGSG